jgi:Tn3 transposase DDE domain-containing protein
LQKRRSIDSPEICTTFAYGTGMGPTQASQHNKSSISARMFSWIHNRHVNIDMQNKAIVSIINLYKKFDLVQIYGSGEAAAADGTFCKIYPI